LSCRPFCMYHSLTSEVHAASTDNPADVLSAHMARWSCVSSAYWWYCALLWCHPQNCSRRRTVEVPILILEGRRRLGSRLVTDDAVWASATDAFRIVSDTLVRYRGVAILYWSMALQKSWRLRWSCYTSLTGSNTEQHRWWLWAIIILTHRPIYFSTCNISETALFLRATITDS